MLDQLISERGSTIRTARPNSLTHCLNYRALCQAVLICAGFWLPPPIVEANEQELTPPLFSTKLGFDLESAPEVFNEVRELILARYYSPELTEQALYWAAIKGMLRHISPPAAPTQGRIWTAEQYQRVLDSLVGRQKSLGVKSHFDPNDGSLTVTHVTRGSPADGRLQIRDRIMRIDGQRLIGGNLGEIESRLNAPAKGEVSLTVVRDIQVIQLTLAPTEHNVPSLESGLLDERTAYLRVTRMTAGVAERAIERLKPWITQGVNNIVLDLRGNEGGVFIEGLRLAELFLSVNTPMLNIVREGKTAQRFVSGNDNPLNINIALLTNKGTASAAEMTIAALVFAGRASSFGEATYGKGIMEQTFTLQNQMRVRFIVGAMYTPTGSSWNDRGIKPTHEVPAKKGQVNQWLALNLSERSKTDTQLRRAWEHLRRSTQP